MSKKITITGLASDGFVDCRANAWADARAGTGDKTVNAAEISRKDALAGSYDNTDSKFHISRVFLYFDLSNLGISELAEIVGVRLKLRGYAYSTARYACAQEGTQGDILAIADFNAFAGSMFGKNAFAWHGTGQNGMSFNQAGIDYIAGRINQTAKLCVREYDHDYLNGEPGDLIRSGIYFAEASSENFKPELEIEYKYPSPLPVEIEDAASGPGKDIQYWRNKKAQESWADVVNAAYGDGAEYPTIDQFIINDNDSSLGRCGISFDLSDLPDGLQITGAVWKIYFVYVDNQGGVGTLIAALVRSTHNPESPHANDYNNSWSTVYASIGPLAHNDTGWKSASLDSAGIQSINQMFQYENKKLRYFIRDKHHDIDKNTPQNSSYNPRLAWTVRNEAEGLNQVMKLELTFTVPNQQSCEGIGWYWYDNACHKELPNTQTACEAAGGHWWDGKCHADLPDTEKECTGYNFYWYYNECQVTNKLGVIPCVCIDTVENIWLAAGHELKEITEVFVTPIGGSGEPRLRTEGFDRYAAYDHSSGLDGKIAVIQFTEEPPEANDSVWCNVKGMMDSQDNLIENPIEILRHFIEKYVGMIEDDNYEKELFDMAVNLLNSRGYKGAGAIIDHPPVREIIEKMTRSINAKSWFNHNDRLCIRLYT